MHPAQWLKGSIVMGVLAGAAATLALAAPAVADVDPSRLQCGPAIEQRLSDVGVAPSDVQSASVHRQGLGGEFRQTVGYTAWLRLKDCKGYLVIDMNAACHIKQTYTKGACAIDGLKNW